MRPPSGFPRISTQQDTTLLFYWISAREERAFLGSTWNRPPSAQATGVSSERGSAKTAKRTQQSPPRSRLGIPGTIWKRIVCNYLRSRDPVNSSILAEPVSLRVRGISQTSNLDFLCNNIGVSLKCQVCLGLARSPEQPAVRFCPSATR